MNQKLQEFISKLADLMKEYDAHILGYSDMYEKHYFEMAVDSKNTVYLDNIHEMEADIIYADNLGNLIK